MCLTLAESVISLQMSAPVSETLCSVYTSATEQNEVLDSDLVYSALYFHSTHYTSRTEIECQFVAWPTVDETSTKHSKPT